MRSIVLACPDRAAGVGFVVDDAIVMVEVIRRRIVTFDKKCISRIRFGHAATHRMMFRCFVCMIDRAKREGMRSLCFMCGETHIAFLIVSGSLTQVSSRMLMQLRSRKVMFSDMQTALHHSRRAKRYQIRTQDGLFDDRGLEVALLKVTIAQFLRTRESK